jgi:diguanylate cyclase (GGDEF)-like protein
MEQTAAQGQAEGQRQAILLIVDDNPDNIQLAARALKDEGYRLSYAESGGEMLEKCRAGNFDLLLLDVMMPEMDGYEACRRVKEIPGYEMVPVIFLTAKADKSSVIEGFDAGGVDYIMKPFYGQELRMRVRTHLALKQYRDRLDSLNQELYHRATEDALTGMYNRRMMSDYLDYEINRAVRTGGTLAVLLADIDHFKAVNDTHGHDCGDAVLQQIASVLRGNLRDQDIVARWGGEEFLVLLPDTDAAGALTVAEHLRSRVETRSLSCGGAALSITMTFGAAEYSPEKERTQLVKEADLALYQGKRQGRNRSQSYSPDSE